jgi:simple sugar transport system permease protein
MSALRRAYSLAIIPVGSIVLALIVGSLLIIVSSLIGGNRQLDVALPLHAYGALVRGAFGNVNGIVNTINAATPLVLTGLAVGVGFKAGLFNIGGTGQVLVGGFTAALVGSAVASQPTAIALPVAIAAGPSAVRSTASSRVRSRRSPVPTRSSPRSCSTRSHRSRSSAS